MIPPWTLVLGYEHALRKFANKLVSQKGYKFGEAFKKAWKDATKKERHFISPLSLYGKRSEPPQPTGAEKPGKGSQPRTFQARAPLRRPITTPSASATMPKAAARKELSVISLTFARYASGNTQDIHSGPAPSLVPKNANRSLRVLYLFSGIPRKWDMQSLRQLCATEGLNLRCFASISSASPG